MCDEKCRRRSRASGRYAAVLLSKTERQIHAGASCIGQGLGTVLTQVVSQTAELDYEQIMYCRPSTSNSPDSGTTSGSRQTLLTGEAAKRAALKLKEALSGKTLEELNGTEYYGEYLGKTDKMGSDVPNPVSHVAYGITPLRVCCAQSTRVRSRR